MGSALQDVQKVKMAQDAQKNNLVELESHLMRSNSEQQVAATRFNEIALSYTNLEHQFAQVSRSSEQNRVEIAEQR